MMNFTDLSNKEQEKIMISEIIRNLKKLGGYATKRELLDAIKKGENTIDENFFMDKYNAEYGIFITTSDFSRSAIEAARQGTRVITLINSEDIADLVAKYKLHVREVMTYELGDFYHTEA